VRFEVNMRDRSGYEVEASYVEVTDGPASSSFTLVGFVPGYPTAILAASPSRWSSPFCRRFQARAPGSRKWVPRGC